MPEDQVLPTQPNQSQVEQFPTLEKKKPINWKVVLLGVLIGLILIAVIGITFWYLTKPKESGNSSTNTTKTSTTSAKPDETANWKTYKTESEGTKYELKYPPNFTISEGLITNKQSLIGNYKDGDLLIGFGVYKGKAIRRNVQYQETVFAGLKAEKGIGTDQDIGGVGVVSYYISNFKEEDDFDFDCTFYPPNDSSLIKTCEDIAKTFKFTN